MNYISTRGQAPAIGFLDAVLAGLAPDGGLYVPKAWPQFSAQKIAGFAGLPYARVAAEVIGAFADGEIPTADLEQMCEEAYASFAHPAVTPIRQLAPGRFLLELFHGPTLAFKDVAMQLLGRLYDYVLERRGAKVTIVCATSGDTGGAAVEAFRGLANVRIVTMFPKGRISEVQRRFMTTVGDANVANIEVDGTFDDCQAILKGLFADAQFQRAVNLSGVNSINFARIAAQSVYFFTSAVALGAPHRKVAFAVPTGNFGDAFAGYVAARMGLPIQSIICATNSNDILARAFQGGRYARGEVAATLSPAMDIQVASNFERLYFEAVRRDAVETTRAFAAFGGSGALDLSPAVLSHIHTLFTGVSVSEDETRATMTSTLNETGELVDPHTAVGLTAARKAPPADPTTPLITLSTAHPAKFPEAVSEATGVMPFAPRGTAALADKTERFERMGADANAIKAFVRDFSRA
ncbi:MAG: threonine synthase [Caulobacteraceae bacterium]|nr:threonine synthase [Caulobacteraceae bacterium]